MTCTTHRTQELRARGFRMTPQRRTILQILHDSGEHLSPSEVYERARQSVPGLTETTVYRTLEFLAVNDMALPAHIGSGHLAYEISGHDHHHLFCRACGREVQIEHVRLQELYAQLEAETGFRLTTSHLTFFGLCPDCKIKLPRRN